MRVGTISNAWVAGAAVLLSQPVVASWIPDLFHSLQSFDVLHSIEKRCDNPCGYYGQVCCASDQFCYTDSAGQAQCGMNSGGTGQAPPQQNGQDGQWQYFTTTYVQTDFRTITTTFSSFVPYVTPAPTGGAQCTYSLGESPCGNVCCHAGQYCQVAGSCMEVPGGSSQYYGGVYTITTIITNTAQPGIRPTTQTILTLTAGTATGTASFTPAVGTGGAILSGQTDSGGGLSGGAIAGIVIGVLAALVILLIICACCCAKGLIDGILGIFGLGGRKRKRTEETYIEEHHSRRNGAGRRWFGQPARTEVAGEKKKKEGGFGRIAGVAGLLGGLALILGLKRRHDRKDDASSSGYGSSAYYSDYTSDTSPSSVTRTRSRSRSRYSRR